MFCKKKCTLDTDTNPILIHKFYTSDVCGGKYEKQFLSHSNSSCMTSSIFSINYRTFWLSCNDCIETADTTRDEYFNCIADLLDCENIMFSQLMVYSKGMGIYYEDGIIDWTQFEPTHDIDKQHVIVRYGKNSRMKQIDLQTVKEANKLKNS